MENDIGSPVGGGAAAPPTPPTPQPSPSGVDAAAYERELAQLRDENARFRSGLSQLQPYREELERLASGDQEYGEFLRRATRSFDDARRTSNPVPEELRPIAEKVDKLDRFVDEFSAAQARAAEEPRRRWLSEGKAFCEGLAAKHPNELGRTVDPTFAWAGALENICASRGLSWEEGWKILEPAFVKPKSSAPPSSMRGDAGMPGLPPPSRTFTPTDGNGQGKKLGQIVLERMQNPT